MTSSYKIALAAAGVLLVAVIALTFSGGDNEPTLALGPTDETPEATAADDPASTPPTLPSRENTTPPDDHIVYSDDTPVADPPDLMGGPTTDSKTFGRPAFPADPFDELGSALPNGSADPMGSDPFETGDGPEPELIRDAPTVEDEIEGAPAEPVDEPPVLPGPTPIAIGPVDPVSPEPTVPGRTRVEPEPTEPAVSEAMTIYVVEAGDSMSSIALAHYGSGGNWVDIAQANPRVDPNRLSVGQELRLPRLDDQPADAGASDTPEAPAASDDLGPGTVYTVKSGDSLSRIAKQFYSSSAKWELIYQANRDTIGDDPAGIKPGMKLRIPPPDRGAN